MSLLKVYDTAEVVEYKSAQGMVILKGNFILMKSKWFWSHYSTREILYHGATWEDPSYF